MSLACAGRAVAAADPDSESAPAPLLIHGRPSLDDTGLAHRGRRAQESYQAGMAYERDGAPAAAIASYRNAVLLDAGLKGPNERMGRLFEAVGQFHEAAKCFGAEYGLNRANRDVGRRYGLALARSGEIRKAVGVLEGITRRWPNDGASWQALGFAYMGAKRTPQAEVALRRAVALGPDLSSEHRDLGALLASRGRDADARAEYRKAVALDPREPTVWVNLGNLERRGGNLAEAMRCYDQALERDSTLGLAWQGRIGALLEAHREADAGAAYRRWINAVPGDLDARLEAVRWFDGQGRRDIALELARDGVRKNPGAADAHLVLGMALETSGNTRSALAEFRRAESMSAERTAKDRVRQLIAALRAGAPDSLRAMFDADSAAHRR